MSDSQSGDAGSIPASATNSWRRRLIGFGHLTFTQEIAGSIPADAATSTQLSVLLWCEIEPETTTADLDSVPDALEFFKVHRCGTSFRHFKEAFWIGETKLEAQRSLEIGFKKRTVPDFVPAHETHVDAMIHRRIV